MGASLHCHLVGEEGEGARGGIVNLRRIMGEASSIVPTCNQDFAIAEQRCGVEDTPNTHLPSGSEFSCSWIVKFRRRKSAQLRDAPEWANQRPVHASDHKDFPIVQ